MFLQLPIELQHYIYDMLDLKSRIKLNIAIPVSYKIQITQHNNPHKDRMLGWLMAAIKQSGYASLDKIGHNWQNFIKENYGDPTIADIVRDADNFRNKIILQQAIESHRVHIDQQYAIETQHWRKSMIQWIGYIAKHADGNTFENIAKNESLKQITNAIMNTSDDSFCKNFFFGLISCRNRDLLHHIVHTYSKNSSWVAIGIETIANMMDINFTFDVVKLVCEVLPETLSASKKQKILHMALHCGATDTIEYLIETHGIHI